MRILYMGNSQRGITCLKALHKSKHDIIYAVAQDGEEGWYESIFDTAKELQTPVSIENNPNAREFIEKARALNPDLIVMCGYSKVIGGKLRSIPTKGCINCHAGKLPHYRGASPLNWALINGEKEIGLSIFFVDDGIDTGPVICQEIIEVSMNDTIKDVLQKTLDVFPKILLEVCNEIEKGNVTAKPQIPEEGSYYTNRFPRDGLIDWQAMTDLQIYNLFRALTHPYPGAFFYYKGRKVFVWESRLERRNYYGVPGRVATIFDDGIVVISKNRGLRVTKVQIDGDKERNPKELFKISEDLK